MVSQLAKLVDFNSTQKLSPKAMKQPKLFNNQSVRSGGGIANQTFAQNFNLDDSP